MHSGRVVISMDSHTELVVDLKPYLASKYAGILISIV